jgi:DNA polymerase
MLGVSTPEIEGVLDFFADPLYPDVYPNIPDILLKAINDNWTFVAHNARFEQEIWWWICTKRWGWPMPRKWSCTAARARYWGVRGSLAGAADDLELPLQKASAAGDSFIKTFCVPRAYRGAKKHGIISQLWAEPRELPEAYALGKEYCLRDVQVEKQIDELLPDLPEFEQRVWDLDFKINTHGIPIDLDSVAKAVDFSEHYCASAVQRFNDLTSVNPTQREKVLGYINAREEQLNLPDLKSKTLTRLALHELPHDLQEIVSIRLDCARASVKKLKAMYDNTSTDGYARGLFMYYGAHTGRWSGKRLQPHNFIRGDAKQSDHMFKFLTDPVWRHGVNGHTPRWIETADILFPRPLKTLSMSMRGFIKPHDGYILSGDYAQVEARVLAWLANCHTLLDAFAHGEDVYVHFAADHMYRRKYEDYFNGNGKVRPEFADERQRAKSAVLGCGFQLGPIGFLKYCDSQDIIIKPEEAEFTVKAYRSAYPEISDYNTGLWARTGYCAIKAVENEGEKVTLWGTPITFQVKRVDQDRWWLVCTLPSGRHIAYYRPKIDSRDQWGKPVLSFRTEWRGGTYREATYGGKLVENIVQGVARDICAIGALNADAAGFTVIAMIHDEIVTQRDTPDNIELLKHCLLDMPEWCKGLPLDADVKSMVRYSK